MPKAQVQPAPTTSTVHSISDGKRKICIDDFDPDYNGDGVVDEWERRAYESLKAADEDGDGQITLPELYTSIKQLSFRLAATTEAAGKKGGIPITDLNPDTDGDGKVEKWELDVFERIQSADADASGVISNKELFKVIKDASDTDRLKRMYRKAALMLGALLLFALLCIGGMTVAVVAAFKDQEVSDNIAVSVGGNSVINTAERTVAVPLYVAPVLPVDELGAIRWLAASHDDVLPADPLTPTVVSIGHVRSIFHIDYVRQISPIHIDFHSHDGRILRISNGNADLIDPTGASPPRSLCVAQVSCASLTVDAHREESLHRDALTALLEAGVEIAPEIRAQPMASALLEGPLASLLADATSRRRLSLGLPAKPQAPLPSKASPKLPPHLLSPGEKAPHGLAPAPEAITPETAPHNTTTSDADRHSDRRRAQTSASGLAWSPDVTEMGCLISTDSGKVTSTVTTRTTFGSDTLAPVYTSCTVSDGHATFIARPYNDPGLRPDWAPYKVTFSAAFAGTAGISEGEWSFNGGTLVQHWCDDTSSSGAFIGTCRISYSYSDSRGLSSDRVKSILEGRTTYENTWYCSNVAATGLPTRQCSMTDAQSEYTVRALEWEELIGWTRTWKAPLPEKSTGSYGLPPFTACDAGCRCNTYPALYWDVTDQEWVEDVAASQCGQTDYQTLQSSCLGTAADRVPGVFNGASDADIYDALHQGKFFLDYRMLSQSMYDVHVAGAPEPNPKRFLQLYATLGVFQRKFAKWVPKCAQPGLSTYYRMVKIPDNIGTLTDYPTDPNALEYLTTIVFERYDLPFDDSAETFHFGNWWAASGGTYSAQNPAHTAMASNCHYIPETYSTYQDEGLTAYIDTMDIDTMDIDTNDASLEAVAADGSRRALKRRRKGCRAYNSCASRNGRAPPRQP